MSKKAASARRIPAPPIQLRENQDATIRNILRAFDGGTRTVFLHAPVGSGKSLIHLLVAKELGSAYVTTPQVLLVNQYGFDTADAGKFAGLGKTLYGRRNYPCPHERRLKGGNRRANADGAACTFLEHWPRECPQLRRCPYYLARHNAQVSSTTVTTLAYAVHGIMRQIARTQPVEHGEEFEDDEKSEILGPGWGRRSLLVVDEAHGLPADLVTFFAVEVGEKTLPGFPFAGIGAAADPLEYMREALPPYLLRLYEGLEELGRSGGGNEAVELRILEEQHKLIRRTERFIENLSRAEVEWVHDYDPVAIRHRWRPLSVAAFAGALWSQAPRILLSSATFFGFETLESDLGLPGPFEVLSVPDTFPPASAPIFLESTVNLSKDSMQQQLPLVVNEIARISTAHRKERGLIHCNSYLVRDFLQRNAEPALRRRLVFHNRDNRIESMEDWKSDGLTDSIFVGVAMSEGLDLLGELARWQVIIKAPFPNLGDVWVARRQKRPDGQTWYTQETIIDLLQACGRIMRSKDDRGATYILDGNAERILQRNWRGLPDWFRLRVEAAEKLSTAS